MPPVMPYVSNLTGEASFYPSLRKKGRSERSVTVHRLIVDPQNTIEDALRVAVENLPLDADNLATAIHKIAKLRRVEDCPRERVTDDPRWVQLIDKIVENGTAFIWPMRQLSLVAWAISSLWDRRILPLIFHVAAKRVSVGSVPQDLSSIAWAVATSRAKDEDVHALLGQISKEAERRVKDFVPQDVAMCAWAFAKVHCRDMHLLRLFGNEVVERFAQMNGQNIANMVWALATVREMHEPLMTAVAQTRADRVKGLGAQEFSNIVWSFATLRGTSEKLFRRTAIRVVETAEGLDAQHIANITWAFAKISHRDDGLFYVLSREAMRSQKVTPLNMANLAWAFASAGWHGEMSTRRVGLRDPEFFDWIADVAVTTEKPFTPQNCSNLVWAFATMRMPHTTMFDSMALRVQRWLPLDWDPQHLSNVLWSFAKLALHSDALFHDAAEEVVRRGLQYLVRSTQNISNVIWAFGTLAVKHPALLEELRKHITGNSGFYERLTEGRPLGKSSRAQLAMIVLSLHRLGLTDCAWHLFDRISKDGLQAGGESYCNWLFIAGETDDVDREIEVWEQMAKTSHTRGLQAAIWNCAVIRAVANGDTRRAQLQLQAVDDSGLCNAVSEHLRLKVGAPAPRSPVQNIDWRRREKEEHEWVTNSLGFSLRLNKIEYYKEVGTLHYILKNGSKDNVPSIHRSIETFTREQELAEARWG